MKPRPFEVIDSPGGRLEANALRFKDRSALIFEDQHLTWSELNAVANRYSSAMKAEGLGRGDNVSVMMENRVEFLALLMGLNKIGVTAGLLNTNLTSKSLIHCITVTHSKKCIFGEEVMDSLQDVYAELPLERGQDFLFIADSGDKSAPQWSKDLGSAAESADAEDPVETSASTLGDTAFYIYTSGTTGLPKAAVISNRRYLISGDMAGTGGLKCKTHDRIYLCLPLYHATGLLLGVGAALATGASMFVRRKFSASNFLNEIRQHNCTHMIYIGELCRYLVNSEHKTDDANTPLRTIMGNGLRPDIWMTFKKRYGISRICEFYGASEGNVAFANLMNKDLTVGMTSAEVSLVQYDVDNDEIVRDNQGFCIPVMPGEAGLLLGKITPDTVFEGYTDKAATEGKVLRSALQKDDAWFNTGDLMRTVDVGYALGYDHYQFVDRVGDTFRWKAENVSTNEVGEIINAFPEVKFCNVYGVEVPGADGRAGMVSITLSDDVAELNLEAFAQFVQDALPSYAVPVFIRVDSAIDVTGTFKMLKGELRQQGFNIDSIEGPVFVMKSGEKAYSVLDDAYLQTINRTEAGF
jgi:citronellyl-CoA synthetase